MNRAEKAVVDLLGTVLTLDADWTSAAIAFMRRTLVEVSTAVPEFLAADEKQLREIEMQMANLLNVMAKGLDQSSAVRDRFSALEAEAETLREKIDHQRGFLAQPVALPDDRWIQDRIADLAAVLKEDTPAAAILLRKLLGKVTAHPVKVRGRKRGYAQLRFRIDAFQALCAALEGRLPYGVTAAAGSSVTPAGSPEFTIALGRPSRMDERAPKIVEMRANGVPWNEISRIAGMSPGNAWTAWKRWTADDGEDSAAA